MPRYEARKWTDEELADLRRMVKTHTWEEIGAHIGCSERTARAKANALGLRKYILHMTDPRQDQKLHAHSEQHGIQSTAEKFGVSTDHVKQARRRIHNKRREITDMFSDPERARRFRFACYKQARAMGIGYDAEEFAGWAIIKTLEGRNTTIKNLCLDYIREEFGREDSGSNEVREAIRWAMPLKEDPDPEVPGVVVASTERKRSQLFAVADKLGLDLRHRTLFLLHYREGLYLEEAAMYLGVSAGRASQMMSWILDRLTNNTEAKTAILE